MDDLQNRNLLIYSVNRGGWKNKHQTYPTFLPPTSWIMEIYWLSNKLELFRLHCFVHEYVSYIEYIELKIPLQSRSFPMHSYDIIKCSSNCARWLPIIRLSNSSLPKVVCNHMPLIVCFSMIVLRGGGGVMGPKKIIYIFSHHTWNTRSLTL